MKPKLYLIPNLLGSEGKVTASIPAENLQIIDKLSHFAVEHLKDSRRFLVKCKLKHKIEESTFVEINKHSEEHDFTEIYGWLKKGHSVGVISDAGCPGIADPGSRLCRWAHQQKIQVVPLVGPSSILLALIASGMNGQSFAFHGYLEREADQRKKQLLRFQEESKRSTQIFMETPYRNESLMEDLMKHLNANSLLAVAADLSLPSEEIRVQTVADWRKRPMKLNKRPAIFLLGN